MRKIRCGVIEIVIESHIKFISVFQTHIQAKCVPFVYEHLNSARVGHTSNYVCLCIGRDMH